MPNTVNGLNNLGRCVDLIELDPLDIVSSCKITQAVRGSDEPHDQGDYSVPKGVMLMSPCKLRVTGGETLMSNSY